MSVENINIITTEKLNSFLSLLKMNGFSISIQTYLDATKLLQSLDQKSFKNYLSAAVCKSEEQSDQFSTLFDIYFNDTFNPQFPPPPPDFNWLKITLSIIFLGFLIYLVSLVISPKPIFTPEKVIKEPYFNVIGEKDTIHLDSLIKNQKKIPDLKIDVKLNNQLITGKIVTFSKIGKNKLSINLKSEKKSIDTIVHFKKLFIAHINKLKIESNKKNNIVHKNEKIVFTSPIDTAIPYKHYWLVNNDTMYGSIINNASTITTRFTKTGKNEVTIAYNTSKDSILNSFPKKYYSNSYIQEIDSEYSIDIKPITNKNYDYSINRNFTMLLVFLALIFITISGLFLIIYIRKKRKKEIIEVIDEGNAGKGKPYDLPFRDKEYLIKNKTDLIKITQELKKQIEDDFFTLDIPKTIQATIRNFGLLTPEKLAKIKQSQYLILINEEFTNSQQLKLFKFLVSKMLKEQVIIDFYFYYQTPIQFYIDNTSVTYNILQLQDLHYSSQLIIMSKGYEFLASNNEGINCLFKNEFNYWEKRVLITPISQKDWSQNELNLKHFFSIVPADIEGLMQVVQLLNDQIEISQIGVLKEQYTNKFVDFYDINSLKIYLKNNQNLFQWICALACFPRLEWNIILSVGDLILEGKNTLDYETLLRIVRIDWMHKGTMSANLRFNLLKELEPQIELKSRHLLAKLLNEYPIDPSTFAYEEKRAHQINNNFILYASGYNTDQNTKRDHDLFLRYYQSDRVNDFALLKYLEKEESDVKNHGKEWETPINIDGQKSNDIKNYIRTILSIEENIHKKWLYTCLLFLLIGLLPLAALYWINTHKENIFQSQINTGYHVINGIRPTPKLTFTPNNCSRYLYKFPQENSFLINYGYNSYSQEIPLNRKFDIQLDTTKNVLYSELKIGSDIIRKEIVINKEESYELTINGEKCPDTLREIKSAIYLQYFPERIKDSIKLFQELLSSKKIKYNEGLEYRAATSKSEIRYFSEKDQILAKQLAKDASEFFNQKIEAVNPKLSNAKASPIEIWIRKKLKIEFKNTSSKSLTQVLNDAKNYTIYNKNNITNITNKEINTLSYSSNYSLKEVKELATLLIKGGASLKAIKQLTNLENYDFQVGNSDYSNSDYINLTVNDVANNRFQISNKSCISDLVGNKYVIYFDYGKSNIRPDAEITLSKISNIVIQNPKLSLLINSYDGTGTKAYSQKLSQDKSRSVSKWLIKEGVESNRIKPIAMGNTNYRNQSCFNRTEIEIINYPDFVKQDDISNDSQKEGYLYYGIYYDGKWKERNFIKLKDSLGVPEEGDIIKSIRDVNIRERETQIIEEKEEKAKSIGIIKTNTVVNVKKVIKLGNGYIIWIVYDLYNTEESEILKKEKTNGTRKKN